MTEQIKNGLSDAAKVGLSFPQAIVIGALIVGGAIAFGKLQTAMEYQEKLAKIGGELTAAQIEVASLKNAALIFSQENARLTRDNTRCESQMTQQLRGR